MSSPTGERPSILQNRAQPENGLVGLATQVLQEIMQIRAGLTTPSIELRPLIDALIKQLEQRGDKLGYKERHLQTIKFALAAFVDETVLIADFPLREEWEKYPLQLEYVGEHLAGLTFFERLEATMKNPQGEADFDVIEVCYLCLLLGYKGKYNIYYEEQLKVVIQNIADLLRRAGRLQTEPLSPHWKVTDQPKPVEDPGWPKWMQLGGSVAISLLILIYLLLNSLLISELNRAKEQLLR
ncbi:MAG TPA: type IVB secretion system protein IcmH/DotU [Blastocatellia bacterium]|nr:type IVB secretion system protein IcmH/DotU [Blastocatellia bacterium]